MDSISQKVAFLIEMFEDLDTTFIEELVSNDSSSRLEQLVNQCLNEIEKQQQKSKQEPTDHEFAEMISLIPASTASYFSDNHNDNGNQMNIDHKNDDETVSHSLFDAMSEQYHIWFQQYVNNTDIIKIMDIYNHLSLMTEQYKIQYDNNQHFNYNANKLNELNSCILMVNTLMKNIDKSPTMDKYRRIRESNKSFQKKIAHVDGSKLLLKLCGWDHIQNTENKNDGIYIFNSTLTLQWIEMVSKFIGFYIQQEIQPKKTQHKDINVEFPIITDFPRKKLKPKNVKMGKKKRILPKINKLSNDELRLKRLKNLGNILDENYGKISNENGHKIGPIADGIMDLNAPNLRNELKQIAKKKHKKWLNSRQSRKRIFTMRDIEQLRKEEFDRKAAGPKTSNEMDGIGKEALQLTNEFRKQNGLSPCTWHQALCDIGKVHSKNMSEGKVPFGHQGFNDRVKQYPFRAISAAENVAMSNGLSEVAKVAVNGWIDSPGHRKNLLSNNNYCGIGVHRGYNGAYYLTQLFGLTNM